MMHEIQIPFAGFYYSIHDDEITREIENIADYFAEDCRRDIPESLMNLFWDAADFAAAQGEYAATYVSAFCDEYLPGAEYSGMDSPLKYNFATDRVFAKIPRDTVAMLWRKTDKAILDRIVRERFTSRDGFISHYCNNWRDWGKLSTWDHNQLGTLLLAYLETESGETWDDWKEYGLMECYGGISNALWANDKANRAWRIFDYLRERSCRKVKNMAQRRIAFMRPWETTPLGSLK